MNIGKRIKKLREELNMTQKQFSDWLNIPLQTLRQWEQGKRTPPNYVYKLIEFKCDKSTNGEQIKIFN